MNRLILASVSLLALSSAAFAADLAPAPVEPIAPVVAPSYVWTGVYGGLQAAYSWGQTDGKNYGISGQGTQFVGTVDSDGFSGGAYLGANYQFENTGFVVGAEIDGKFGAIDGKDDLIGVGPSAGRPNSPTSARISWDGAARLRVGYAFDRFLPYIAGGVAGADFRYRPRYPTDKSVP
ncbi:MAG: outer membrane protein, partial [Bradyrhizobium sp.]